MSSILSDLATQVQDCLISPWAHALSTCRNTFASASWKRWNISRWSWRTGTTTTWLVWSKVKDQSLKQEDSFNSTRKSFLPWHRRERPTGGLSAGRRKEKFCFLCVRRLAWCTYSNVSIYVARHAPALAFPRSFLCSENIFFATSDEDVQMRFVFLDDILCIDCKHDQDGCSIGRIHFLAFWWGFDVMSRVFQCDAMARVNGRIVGDR